MIYAAVRELKYWIKTFQYLRIFHLNTTRCRQSPRERSLRGWRWDRTPQCLARRKLVLRRTPPLQRLNVNNVHMGFCFAPLWLTERILRMRFPGLIFRSHLRKLCHNCDRFCTFQLDEADRRISRGEVLAGQTRSSWSHSQLWNKLKIRSLVIWWWNERPSNNLTLSPLASFGGLSTENTCEKAVRSGLTSALIDENVKPSSYASEKKTFQKLMQKKVSQKMHALSGKW